jgi:hypothetical protein
MDFRAAGRYVKRALKTDTAEYPTKTDTTHHVWAILDDGDPVLIGDSQIENLIKMLADAYERGYEEGCDDGYDEAKFELGD